MRTLVTGFLGFGRFATNPSAELARTCGRPHELIEVSYAAADAFVSRVGLAAIDQVVLMGVAGLAALHIHPDALVKLLS